MGKNVVSYKEMNEIRKSALKYVRDYRSIWDKGKLLRNKSYADANLLFSVGWGKLSGRKIDKDASSGIESIYGYALVINTIAVSRCSEVTVGKVNDLRNLIEKFDKKNKGTLFRYKQAIFYSLGICYCNLGNEYGENAIEAFKKYFFNAYSNSRASTKDKKFVVYSFRKISKHLFESLIDNKLNVSSPVTFNDPFDCPIMTLLDSSDRLSLLLRAAYKDTLKIACFAKGKKSEPAYLNALMWAHYTDSHKGICIKYRFNKSFGIAGGVDNSVISTFKNVNYSNDKLADLGDKTNIKVDETFTLKAKCWEYENELRYLYFDSKGSGDYDMVGNTNGCIEAVYFGLRCSERDKKAIIQILSCNHGTTSGTGKKIKFFQMKMNDKKFGTLKENRLSKRDITILLM